MSLPSWNVQVAEYVTAYGEEPPSIGREFLELSHYLESHKTETISIEILPSISKTEHGSTILSDGCAVAIGKTDLVKAFLFARSAYFGDGKDAFSRRCSSQEYASEKIRAARIILVANPEHITASNYLKRAVLSAVKNDASAVQRELLFLQSILTSPLHKHSKSPTLWYHRFWLVKTFMPWEQIVLQKGAPERRYTTAYKRAQFWRDEYKLARQAAEQHEKNFYAFQYLRRLWDILWQEPEIFNYHLRADVVGSETIRRLSQWCKQHPTDISGWTFMVWLCCRPQAGHNMKILAQGQIRAIETFREKLGWHGASVEYALTTMRRLAPIYFPNKPICALRTGKGSISDESAKSIEDSAIGTASNVGTAPHESDDAG